VAAWEFHRGTWQSHGPLEQRDMLAAELMVLLSFMYLNLAGPSWSFPQISCSFLSTLAQFDVLVIPDDVRLDG